MSKNLFRPNEIHVIKDIVTLDLRNLQPVDKQDANVPVEEPTSEAPSAPEPPAEPSIDALRAEAEEFRRSWEQERKELVARSQQEAENIVSAARQEATNIEQEAARVAEQQRQQYEAQAKQEIAEAQAKSQALVAEAEQQVKEIEAKAVETGEKQGRQKGFEVGRDEATRLAQRLHTIISRIVDRRDQIFDQAEYQLAQVAMLIARKVTKVISEEYRDVVRRNIRTALKKLKGRVDIVIRVSTKDIESLNERVEEFLAMVEKHSSISLVEDPEIEPGGCVVESDVGEIDARISSQLRLIENEIRELLPVRARARPIEE